jgi:hypothetical protein
MTPRLLLTLALLGAALLIPRSAFACSKGLGCEPPVRLFPEGAPVPGNLIYFKLKAAEPSVLTLRSSDGRSVPASIRSIGMDRVFAPDADVAPDLRLELEYTPICPQGPQPTQARFAFTTAPAQPLEIPTPTLSVVDRAEATDHGGAHGVLAAGVSLRYAAVCKTCSAAHLTDTHFDGDEGWGHVSEHGIDLLTGCEGLQVNNSCTGDALAPPGNYVVRAWSTVVGESKPPARAVREVELRCDLDGCAVGGSRQAAHGGAALGWVALALLSRRHR